MGLASGHGCDDQGAARDPEAMAQASGEAEAAAGQAMAAAHLVLVLEMQEAVVLLFVST